MLCLLFVGATPTYRAWATDATPDPWQTCFQEAGARYELAPDLLKAIAKTESGFDPSAVNQNKDGSRDIGLMQINTRWLPTLREYGIDPSSLYQPCSSIWIGAWVLAGSISRMGNTWEAVGAYNAGEHPGAEHAQRRAAYAHSVSARLGEFRSGDPTPRLHHHLPAKVGIAEFTFGTTSERGSDCSDPGR